MPRLVVRLLGGYRVELDGEPVYGFETDKARALLAYLMVEADRPHRRETLAGLLWPDRPDAPARNSLRHTVFRVRQALAGHAASGNDTLAREPAPFLFVTPMDVQFNTASDYSLDVAELAALASRYTAYPPAGASARVAELLPEAFCGEFLAGFSVRGSEAFQAWMLSKQEYYHRITLDVLDAQNAAFEALDDYEGAVAAARLQLKLEPWLEEAHRRCMRGLALAGRRDEALRQYDACCRALEAELGVDPAASTRDLYAAIRNGTIRNGPIRAGRLTAPARGGTSSQGRTRPVSRPQPGMEQPQEGAAAAERLPPMPEQIRPPVRIVAREDELEYLSRHLDGALAGETGVAFVSGDPGSGKTALLEAFAALAIAQHPDLIVAGARCSARGHLDPLAPLRKLAEMLFGDLADELAWRPAGREQVGRLQRATDLALAALAEHGSSLLGTLVPAVSVSRRAETIPLAAIQEDQKPADPLSQGALFDQLTRTLAAIARRQPLLLLFDDLHWVDDATAAFLLHLGRGLTASRVLVLGAYRSTSVALGRRDPGSGEVLRHPLAEVINELRRARGEILIELDRADGRAFVEAYVDTEPNRLGARFRDALYAHTGGQALFTVESLRNLQARGQLVKDEAGRWVAKESVDWGALPARVEAAIAERIDRLPEREHRILSAASVQGDDFTGEVVAELTGDPVREVISRLSGSLARQHHLVRPEGLERLGGGQRSVYRFTHHLFQKYLYEQLDPVERAQMHAGVAAALNQRVGDDPLERERVAAGLAWHYEAGGMPLPAARALLDAGQQAMRVAAYREALERFDHGLALLGSEPPPAERTPGERAEVVRLLEVARLAPQRNLDGIAGPQFLGTLARASAAWAGAPGGGAQGHARLLMLSAELERLMAAGHFAAGLAAAERLRDEATRCGEEDFAGQAGVYFGMIHHFMGNPQPSEEHLERALAWLTPERRARLRVAVGIDLPAVALSISALNRWSLGYPEQALARSQEAIAAARADRAAGGQACSTAYGASLEYLLRSDEDPARAGALAELSEQCYRLCLEHSLSMWRYFADVLLGRVMVVRGDDVASDNDIAGIERMWADGWRRTTLVCAVDFFMVLVADSCLLAAGRRPAGDPAASAADPARARLLAIGLAATDNMVGPARLPWAQTYAPEVYRLRGELLLARDGLPASEEAVDCYRQAMQLGREKGALAWQLRAAMSLVRLRERQCGPRSAAEWGGKAYSGELAALGEARRCLRDIYGRFTEGFACQDLQDAAALLGKHPRQEIGEAG